MQENAQSEKTVAADDSPQEAKSLHVEKTEASLSSQSPTHQTQAFNLEEIKKHIPKAFQGYIEPIIQWAQSVEARFKAIETELPNTVKTKMAEAIQEAQVKARTQAGAASQTGQPQGAQTDMGSIIGLVSEALKGGGQAAAPNPFALKAQELALKGMEESVSFTSMLNSYMKQKLAQGVVKEVVDKVLP
jgi:hypothetical protein